MKSFSRFLFNRRVFNNSSFQFSRRNLSFHHTIGTRRTISSFQRFLIGSTFAAGLAMATFSSSSSTAITAECSGKKDPFAGTPMYPPIKAYDKGFLKVSDVHTIAYSQYGNPQGKPVLFIHGGPGAGTSPNHARFFDPKVYRIILVDQRGCGESTPFANLEDNTTYDSVRDFEKIRTKLGISKWQLFGGSWGSTLALAYAIEHPEVVTELVLRGIFLCRQKEFDFMYEGKGSNFIFPEDWEVYESTIPVEERGNFMKAYSRRLLGELGEAEKLKAAKAWSVWEGRICHLIQDPLDQVVASMGNDHYATAFARIENHYFMNHAFFPRDGFLLEKENLAKIEHIPTVIVQGRYDIVCPALSAYDLHKALPKSELHMVLAGHSAFEPEIMKELVNATDKFKNRN